MLLKLRYTRLQKQGEIIHYQSYVPTDKDLQKKPWVVVIQDDFMKSMTFKFFGNNFWALDSTSKGMQFDSLCRNYIKSR